jgi:hypothetical protein
MSSRERPSGSARVSPITRDDVATVARFLHENLNSRISAENWLRGISPAWSAESPNHGMMLRVDERLVGAFPAIYYTRDIAGSRVSICNPHSWFVLESHRKQSMSLVLSLVRQKEYQFVMLTPNATVAEIFQFLKFRLIDSGLIMLPALPWPLTVFDSVTVATQPVVLDGFLDTLSLQVYKDHCELPWLLHLAVGDSKGQCYIVFKRHQIKGVPVARVLHISDPSVFHRLWRSISNALILRFGLFGVLSEARWLTQVPWPAIRRVNGQPKLLSGDLLDDHSIDDLYTELVALDL